MKIYLRFGLFSLVYALIRGCIQRETWGMRPNAGAYYSFTLHIIVDTEVNFPPHLQVQREWDGVGKASSIGWTHLYLSAFFHNKFFTDRKRESTRKENRWEMTLHFKIDILWSKGNPMFNYTSTPHHSRLQLKVRGLRICAQPFLCVSMILIAQWRGLWCVPLQFVSVSWKGDPVDQRTGQKQEKDPTYFLSKY